MTVTDAIIKNAPPNPLSIRLKSIISTNSATSPQPQISFSFFFKLRGWLVGRAQARRRSRRRLRRLHAAVTVQSAARASFARVRHARLHAARLQRWVAAAAEMYRNAEDAPVPSPLGAELTLEVSAPSPTPNVKLSSSPLHTSSAPADRREALRLGGRGDRGERELAEALAPRMGRAPPGCPGALDVAWGEWGTRLTLEFPPE